MDCPHNSDKEQRLEYLRDIMFWRILALARSGRWERVLHGFKSYSLHLCAEPYTPSHGEMMRMAHKLLSETQPWHYARFKEKWEHGTDITLPAVIALYRELNIYPCANDEDSHSDAATTKQVVCWCKSEAETYLIDVPQKRLLKPINQEGFALYSGLTVTINTPDNETHHAEIVGTIPSKPLWDGLSKGIVAITSQDTARCSFHFKDVTSGIDGTGYINPDRMPQIGSLQRIIYFRYRDSKFKYHSIATHVEPSSAKYSKIVCDMVGHFEYIGDGAGILSFIVDESSQADNRCLKVSEELRHSKIICNRKVSARAVLINNDEWQVVALSSDINNITDRQTILYYASDGDDISAYISAIRSYLPSAPPVKLYNLAQHSHYRIDKHTCSVGDLIVFATTSDCKGIPNDYIDKLKPLDGNCAKAIVILLVKENDNNIDLLNNLIDFVTKRSIRVVGGAIIDVRHSVDITNPRDKISLRIESFINKCISDCRREWVSLSKIESNRGNQSSIRRLFIRDNNLSHYFHPGTIDVKQYFNICNEI